MKQVTTQKNTVNKNNHKNNIEQTFPAILNNKEEKPKLPKYHIL